MPNQIKEGVCPECGRELILKRPFENAGRCEYCNTAVLAVYSRFEGYRISRGVDYGPLLPASDTRESGDLKQVSCPECECEFSVDINSATPVEEQNSEVDPTITRELAKFKEYHVENGKKIISLGLKLKRVSDEHAKTLDEHGRMAAKIRDDYPHGWPDREQPYGFEGCYRLPEWLVKAAIEFDVSRDFIPQPEQRTENENE